jgi:hypothetical protein
MAEKDKKKTLSISTGFKKKYSFDASSVDKKKTYSIPKKKTFGNNKFLNRNKTNKEVKWQQQYKMQPLLLW